MRRLLTLLSLVLALAGSLLGAASPAQASGDDYPWRTDTTQSADSWGFTKRQCVSFAASELSQHGHAISNRQGWGSAYHWDETARALGKRIASTPKVGAIAQWNANERSAYYPSTGGVGTITAGPYGHVAYVTGVYSDGSVRIEQYNMSGNRSFSAMRVKAPRYLYVAG